jgi:hypothetical protein
MTHAKVYVSIIVATVVLFYKGWRKIQGSPSKGVELNLPIRILSFGLYLALAMRFIVVLLLPISSNAYFLGYSLSLLSVKTPQSPAPDLIIASGECLFLSESLHTTDSCFLVIAASVVVLIFGTQRVRCNGLVRILP